MKKFLDLLSKRKRSHENFYKLYDASVPDDINHHFTETNIFKYYPFDSDSSDLGHGILLNSRVESINNSQECLAQSLSSSNLITSTVTDFSDFQPENNFTLSSTNLDSDSLIIKMKQEEKCKSEKKNIYLINISNSKYFHIGSHKTINVNEKPFMRDTVQGSEDHHWVINYSSHSKRDFQNLLDCEERLSEKYILLISQHVDDEWKEFLNYLGLEEIVLETLEFRNNNSRIHSVYDALKKYITLFPNTSLGFIIYALNEIHQVVVIEKLAQELKI